MHSFLQLAQGIKDLFIMPVEQYQKDGRLMRGFQKGTLKVFLTSIWLFHIILIAHYIPTINSELWESNNIFFHQVWLFFYLLFYVFDRESK